MKLRVHGRGPLVMKVAGLVGGVGLYHEESRAARAAGYRVAELDTGGDRRDDPASGPITWDFLAGEVRSAIEQLGEGPTVLWGTSFGGLVCVATAARYPELVAGLLLASPPHPDWRPPIWTGLYRWAARRRRPERAAARLFRVAFSLLNLWEFALFPTALARLPSLAREGRDADTPARTLFDKLGLLWGAHPGVVDPRRGLPASVICAGCDPVVPYGQSRRLASLIPRARLRVIRLAGHAGAFSRPQTYAGIALEELAAITGRSPVSECQGLLRETRT